MLGRAGAHIVVVVGEVLKGVLKYRAVLFGVYFWGMMMHIVIVAVGETHKKIIISFIIIIIIIPLITMVLFGLVSSNPPPPQQHLFFPSRGKKRELKLCRPPQISVISP